MLIYQSKGQIGNLVFTMQVQDVFANQQDYKIACFQIDFKHYKHT